MTIEDNVVFGAMQTSEPYKSYIKTILGQVYVNIINPFDGKPSGVLLKGNPAVKEDTCILDVWSDKEDRYLKTMNKIHFETGTLIQYKRPDVVEERPKTIEEFSDEELKAVINSKYLALRNTLNKIETTPVLFRMLTLAREMEKSEKIIEAVEARLSEVQIND